MDLYGPGRHWLAGEKATEAVRFGGPFLGQCPASGHGQPVRVEDRLHELLGGRVVPQEPSSEPGLLHGCAGQGSQLPQGRERFGELGGCERGGWLAQLVQAHRGYEVVERRAVRAERLDGVLTRRHGHGPGRRWSASRSPSSRSRRTCDPRRLKTRTGPLACLTT